MRTTVNIHDGLLETVKARAKDEGRTLGDVIEEALRAYLWRVEEPPASGPPLPVFEGGAGVMPGVDLTTNAGLHEVMYAEEDARSAALARGDELS